MKITLTEAQRAKLIAEKEAIEAKKRISPKEFRRINQINSLLMTDGNSAKITFKPGSSHYSKRVTSFSRNRR